MTRVLLASFIGIAALFGGSIFAIAWATSSEQPSVSSTDMDAAPLAVAQVSLPSSTNAPPRTAPPPAPLIAAAATPLAAAPSPSALAERARAEDASRRRPGDTSSRSDGTPSRVVVSARDRHLSVASPEILAQPRSVAAGPAVTIDDQGTPVDAPCVIGSDCEAADGVGGMVAPAPQEGVEHQAFDSQ